MQPWKSGLGLISEIWGDWVFKRENEMGVVTPGLMHSQPGHALMGGKNPIVHGIFDYYVGFRI